MSRSESGEQPPQDGEPAPERTEAMAGEVEKLKLEVAHLKEDSEGLKRTLRSLVDLMSEFIKDVGKDNLEMRRQMHLLDQLAQIGREVGR